MARAFVAAVAARGGGRVHVKLDTGMGRLGTRDPQEATRVAEAAAAEPTVELVAAMTHFATADERGDAFFGEQLERFAAWAPALRERHPGLILHAANSAALLRDADSHFDLVRPASRSTASTRSRRMPPRATSSPRWSSPATSPRSSAARPARARATAALRGARGDRARHRADRLRRRRPPRG
jgi:D-serine deaminase-like pyridoxal phosphate-dependent protein